MIRLRLRCPDCNGKFVHEVDAEDSFPDYCPLCGAYCGNDPDFVPTKMNIGTVKGQAGDIAFRALEASSIARAEMTGNPDLKITNLKDNLREGDVAAMSVPKPSQEYTNIVNDMKNAPDWTGVAPGGLTTADVVNLAGQGRERGSGATALRAIQGGGGTPISAAGGTLKGAFGGGVSGR